MWLPLLCRQARLTPTPSRELAPRAPDASFPASLFVSECVSAPGTHVSGTTQYLLFCVQLLSLGITSSTFTPVVASVNISFLLRLHRVPLFVHVPRFVDPSIHPSIHSSIHGHVAAAFWPL